MAFITMMVARLGGTNANPLGLPTFDGDLFLIMVIYAYFFIALVQLLGIFGGDRSPLQVRRTFSTRGFYKNSFLF